MSRWLVLENTIFVYTRAEFSNVCRDASSIFMFLLVSTLPFPPSAVTWPPLVETWAVVSVSGWCKLLGTTLVGVLI